ncbi:hypothetical protein [Dasineura jujubifolia toursvirus 2a]|nr:hypothetical protein [Dasineura jujubifolia toursvirus 2a]
METIKTIKTIINGKFEDTDKVLSETSKKIPVKQKITLKCLDCKTLSMHTQRKICNNSGHIKTLCPVCSLIDKTLVKKLKSLCKKGGFIVEKDLVTNILQKREITCICKFANHMVKINIDNKKHETKPILCQECEFQNNKIIIEKKISYKAEHVYIFKKSPFVWVIVLPKSKKDVIELGLEELFMFVKKSHVNTLVIPKNLFNRINIEKILLSKKINYKINEENKITIDILQVLDESEVTEESENVTNSDLDNTVSEEVTEESENVTNSDLDNTVSEESEESENVTNSDLDNTVSEESEESENVTNSDLDNTVSEESEVTEESENVTNSDLDNSELVNNIIISNNFEDDKIKNIFENPNQTQNNIYAEFSDNELLKAIDKHETFMHEYYCQLKKYRPIFNNKEEENQYLVFNEANKNKYYKSSDIISVINQNVDDNIGEDIREKNINHYNFIRRIHTMGGTFKNCLDNFVFTPSPITEIQNDNWISHNDANDFLIFLDNFDVKKYNMEDVVEDKQEEKFCIDVWNTAKKIFKEVCNVFDDSSYDFTKKIMTLSKKMSQLYKSDFTLTNIILTNSFMLQNKNSYKNPLFNVDPRIIVSLIFCSNIDGCTYNDAKIFETYFKEYTNTLMFDERANYLVVGSKCYMFSKGALYKILLIDSGVFPLYYKMISSSVFNCISSYSKMESVMSFYALYRPYNFCYFDSVEPIGGFVNNDNTKRITENFNDYIDYTFLFEDLLQILFENISEKFNLNGYSTRFILSRVFTECFKGLQVYIEGTLEQFYIRVMSNYRLLDSNEQEELQNMCEFVKKYLIKSDVKNFLTLGLRFNENKKHIGIIINPKIFLYKEEELDEEVKRKIAF